MCCRRWLMYVCLFWRRIRSNCRPILQHQPLFFLFLSCYESIDCVFIAMEYIPHGDLSQYIKSGSSRVPGDSRDRAAALPRCIACRFAIAISSHKYVPPTIFTCMSCSQARTCLSPHRTKYRSRLPTSASRNTKNELRSIRVSNRRVMWRRRCWDCSPGARARLLIRTR